MHMVSEGHCVPVRAYVLYSAYEGTELDEEVSDFMYIHGIYQFVFIQAFTNASLVRCHVFFRPIAELVQAFANIAELSIPNRSSLSISARKYIGPPSQIVRHVSPMQMTCSI